MLLAIQGRYKLGINLYKPSVSSILTYFLYVLFVIFEV